MVQTPISPVTNRLLRPPPREEFTARIAARIGNLHIHGETSMTGGREPLSRPSSRHGEARQPLTLTFSWVRSRERLARLPRQESAP